MTEKEIEKLAIQEHNAFEQRMKVLMERRYDKPYFVLLWDEMTEGPYKDYIRNVVRNN